jgi:signal transduction histidine kinase
MSTRARFALASMLLLVPFLVGAAIVVDQSFRRTQDQLVISQYATADVVAQSISELVVKQQEELSALAATEPVRAMDQESAAALLDVHRTSHSFVSGLFLLSKGPSDELTVVAQSGGIDIATLPTEFHDAAETVVHGGQPTISDPLLLPTGDLEVVAVFVPVYANPVQNSAETPSGAFGSIVSVEQLVASFQPPSGFASGSDVAIALVTSLEASGDIVSIPGRPTDPSEIFQDGADLADAKRSAMSGQRTRTTFEDPTGLDRVMVGVPIPLDGNDWAVLVSSPTTTAFGASERLIERALLAAAALIVLTLLLAVLIGSWLTRPFRQLAYQAVVLSSGGRSVDAESTGASDAVQLGQTIREMADRLRAQVRDTESAREEIARQAERLRDLLRRTVRLQEDERRRIASDIHDAVSPLITGALYQAQAVRIARSNGNGLDGANGSKTSEASPEQLDSLKEVGELLERAMRELHDVIFDLRPPDLDDIGLVAAIQRHVDQVNRSGLPCTLEVIGEERRLSPEVRLALYRIVQEALHNAIRHARADESVVRLEWLPDQLRLTVQDDGSGFEAEGSGVRAGLGLMSMRERAASIGASLDIVSRPGTGTAVVVERSSEELDLVTEAGGGEPEPDEAGDQQGSMIAEDVVEFGEERVRQ